MEEARPSSSDNDLESYGLQGDPEMCDIFMSAFLEPAPSSQSQPLGSSAMPIEARDPATVPPPLPADFQQTEAMTGQTTLQAPPPLTISHAESLARQMGLEDARRQGRSDLNSMLELPPNFFSTQPTRWPPVLHGGQMGQPSTLYLESFHVQPTQPFTSFVGSQEGTLHPQQPPQYQRTPMQDQCLYQQPALLATGQQQGWCYQTPASNGYAIGASTHGLSGSFGAASMASGAVSMASLHTTGPSTSSPLDGRPALQYALQAEPLQPTSTGNGKGKEKRRVDRTSEETQEDGKMPAKGSPQRHVTSGFSTTAWSSTGGPVESGSSSSSSSSVSSCQMHDGGDDDWEEWADHATGTGKGKGKAVEKKAGSRRPASKAKKGKDGPAHAELKPSRVRPYAYVGMMKEKGEPKVLWRRAVVERWRRLFPNEPMPNVLNLTDPFIRARIIQVVRSLSESKGVTSFSAEALEALLTGPKAIKMFPANNFLDVNLTLTMGKYMSVESGLVAVLAEALGEDHYTNITDRTNALKWYHTLCKNGGGGSSE